MNLAPSRHQHVTAWWICAAASVATAATADIVTATAAAPTLVQLFATRQTYPTSTLESDTPWLSNAP